MVVPQNGCFIIENLTNMDDLGVPLFQETFIYPLRRKQWKPSWNIGIKRITTSISFQVGVQHNRLRLQLGFVWKLGTFRSTGVWWFIIHHHSSSFIIIHHGFLHWNEDCEVSSISHFQTDPKGERKERKMWREPTWTNKKRGVRQEWRCRVTDILSKIGIWQTITEI